MNKIRKQPKSFMPILQQRLQKYDDQTKQYFPIKDHNIIIQTKEGGDAVKQLMIQLNSMQVSPKLNWSFQLHEAADARARQLSSIYSQVSQDQSENLNQLIQKPSSPHIKQKRQIDDVVSKYAQWKGDLSQHVFYGFINPKQLLSEILIDDGNSQREHRKQFFNPQMHYVGIGIDTHYKYKFVVVIIYATHADKKRFIDFQGQRRVRQQSGCGDNCQIM